MRPSCGIFLHIEHGAPDGNPRFGLVLKHPHIPASRAKTFTGTFVNHLISKGDYSRIASDVNVMLILTKFMNLRALTEIAEPGKKLSPSLYATGEAGKDHDDLGVHDGSKVVDLAFQPRPIDSAHGRSGTFLPRVL
jgi:hypothetical protein